MRIIQLTGFLFFLWLTSCQFAGYKKAEINHSEMENDNAKKVLSFSLSDVRLSPSWIRQKEALKSADFHQLDPERLLHNFRVNAGLTSSAKPIEGCHFNKFIELRLLSLVRPGN